MDKYSKSYAPSIGRTSLFEVESTPPPAAHSGASILKRPLNSHPSLPNDQPVLNIQQQQKTASSKRNKSNHQQQHHSSSSKQSSSASSSSSSASSALNSASLIAASASTMGLDSVHQSNLLRHHRSNNPYNPSHQQQQQQSFDGSKFSQAHLASSSSAAVEQPMKLTKHDDHSVKGRSKLVNLSSSKSQIESPRIVAQMDESDKDVPLNLSVKRPMDNDSPAGTTSENHRMGKSSSSAVNSDANRDNSGSHQRKKAKRQQQIHLQQQQHQQLLQLQQQQQKQLQHHQQQLQIQHLQQQSKSLLSNPTEIITIPSIPHENKPRKRGRPPILSPPPEPSRSDGPSSLSASLAASIANNSGLHPAAAASLLASAQGALSPLEIYKTILAQNCFQSMFSPGSFLFPGHLNGDPLAALNRANNLNINNQLSKPHHQNNNNNSNNGNASNSKVIVCEPTEDKRKRDSGKASPRRDAYEGDSDLADTDIDYEIPKVFNEEELRKPLKFGWRRQTLIQCITKSGIRGEVIYYSPSGKKMRNMTELCRYMIKKNVTNVRKENFSFDSRPIIGEFIEHSKEKGTSFNLLSEGEVRVRLDDIKKRLQNSGAESGRSDIDDSVSDIEAKPASSASPTTFKRETPFYNDQKPKEQQTRVTIEEIETLRDDMFKRYQESKESSERRFQTSMFPESDFYKKKDLEMVAEIERERRKQHMMLVRALDNHKKFEEREKRSRQEIAEKRAIMEKKFQKRKAEIAIYRELKRSVEDMLLKNSKALPTLNRIPGLKLPSRVFADCLMFYEFLHNFGETLGFDMESLPSLNNLQKALLNLDDSAEKELVSTLHQLLVCAIDDPGIPCNISTVMGQKLKDAPITDFNLSEILKLYFQSFSNVHSDSSDEEYLPTILYEVLKSGKPFLSLNAAQKMDILSFICNELTNNQAIVRQIEQTVENLIILRREKWVLGCELRKYKAIKLRREKSTSEEAGEALKKFDKTEIDAGLIDDSGESDADDNIIITVHETDEEATITNEELDKKLEKLAKQCAQMNVKLTNAMQCMRVVPLGQDRYRRRFWVLPASGGIFVEGLESGHRDNLYMEDSDEDEADESSETEEETEEGENEDKVKKEEDKDVDMAEGDEKEKDKPNESMEVEKSGSKKNGLKDEVKSEVKEEKKVKEKHEDKRGKKKSKRNQENGEKGKEKAKQEESTVKEETADEEMEEGKEVKESKEEKLETKEEDEIKEDKEDKEDDEIIAESQDKMEVVEVKEVKKEKSKRVKLENLGDGKHSLSPEVTIELKGMTSDEKPSNRETTVTIQPVSAPLKSLQKEGIKCDMEIAGINTIRQPLSTNSDGTWISPVTDGFPRSSLFDSKIGPSNSSDFNSRNGFLDASGFPFETISPERSWFNVVPRIPCNDTTITICPVSTLNAKSSPSTHDPQSTSKVNESNEESDNKPPISSENSSSSTAKPSQNVFMETFVYPHLSGSLFSQNSTNATNGAKTEANSSTNDLQSQQTSSSSSLTNGDIDMSIVNPALLTGPDFEIDPDLLKKLEQHKKQQHRKPKRIPEEFQRGWWIITDIGQIRSIIDTLNEKGFREKHLKKQMTKYLTYVSTNYKAAITEFDICDLDRKVSQESPFGVPEPLEDDIWCKDVALRLDIAVLEQIEALEEKISSSSMQIRGWRPSSKLSTDSSTKFELSALYEIIDKGDESGDDKQKSSTKSDDQPAPKETKGKKKILDPVKAGRERLLATEAGIERRYLKPPLGFKSNTILVTSPNSNGDEYADNAADENAPTGLVRWREAVRECRSGSQLALLLHFLESCIAWDKSIMRASCQFCSGGENEAQLLLCDSCDKGYHMYCFKPKMETVPEGDWFCFECQNKNTIDKVCIICGKKGKLINCDTCPKVFHPNCLDPPVTKPPKGRWCCNMCNRKPKKIVKGRKTMTSLNAAATSGIDETPKKDSLSSSANKSSTPKEETPTTSSKKSKTTNRSKKEAKSSQQSTSTTAANDTTATTTPKETKREKKAKQKSEESKEMVICENLLKDLTAHEDCWPFLFPVNTKQFPTYKKIIKKPMDFETIKSNLKAGGYKNKNEFITDCSLVFDNCETFNEDESPVGIAGHNMRRFMEKRWKELGGEN